MGVVVSRARAARDGVFFTLATTPSHFHHAVPFLPRAGAVKDGALQRRRRPVLDGSEHGRTMMDRREAIREPAIEDNKRMRSHPCVPRNAQHCFRILLVLDLRGNDRNPNGPRPASHGARSCGPSAGDRA